MGIMAQQLEMWQEVLVWLCDMTILLNNVPGEIIYIKLADLTGIHFQSFTTNKYQQERQLAEACNFTVIQ